MRRVLLPIHIDRWRNPIATLLREIASNAPQHQFFSFSGPETNEDRALSPSFWLRPNVRRLRSWEVVCSKFDAVHTASATPRNAFASILTRRPGARATEIFTANTEAGAAAPYERWFKSSLRRADLLVAVSHAVAETVSQQYKRSADRIIPNGVDAEFFSKRASTTPPPTLRIRRPYALYVGAISRGKRPDVFARVAQAIPHHQFVMAGGIVSDIGARNLSKLPSNIRQLGRVDRSLVRDLMAHANVLLFPSQREGLPLSVIEALSVGIPVVAQPLSSMPELIVNGLNGWLIHADDLSSWVDKTSELLEWSESQLGKFGESVRAQAIGKYAWQTIGRAYAELYEAASV